MGKHKKKNHKEIISANDFDDRWNACRCWLEGGPATYQGKFYVKDYEDDQGSIEQILVDKVPDEIRTIIEIVWEDAIIKQAKDPNFNLTQYISEELHYELPFRNSENADRYNNFNREGEELRLKYIQSFNPYLTLTSIFANQQANCVAHALAIKESIPDKAYQLFNVFYDGVYDEDGFEKLGIHTILAKIKNNKILTIDSSEGPINNKDKTNQFQYIMDIETFCRNYTPALFKSEMINKK